MIKYKFNKLHYEPYSKCRFPAIIFQDGTKTSLGTVVCSNITVVHKMRSVKIIYSLKTYVILQYVLNTCYVSKQTECYFRICRFLNAKYVTGLSCKY
jgi:hypothetical protein